MPYTKQEIFEALRESMVEGIKTGALLVVQYVDDEDTLKRANKAVNERLRLLLSVDAEEAVNEFTKFENEDAGCPYQ